MWIERVAAAVKSTIAALIDMATVFTELARQVVIVVDDAADALKAALTAKPPVPPAP